MNFFAVDERNQDFFAFFGELKVLAGDGLDVVNLGRLVENIAPPTTPRSTSTPPTNNMLINEAPCCLLKRFFMIFPVGLSD